MTEAPGHYFAAMHFTLHGAVVPKARARVTRNGTYHPHRYQNWKAIAIGLLFDQAKAQLLDIPIQKASVQIDLIGKHPRRGDLDNVAGSILDALVQAGILRNDNMTCLSSLLISLEHGGQEPEVKIRVSKTT